MLKLLLIKFADVLILLQQAERVHQQIIVIHHIVGLLAVAENAVDRLQLFDDGKEVGVVVVDDAGDRFLRIRGEAKDIEQHRALGQGLVLGIEPHRFQRRHGVILRVIPIQDGKVVAKTKGIRVAAEELVRHGVEGAAPDAGDVLGEEITHALQHLARGFVREGEEEDVLRLHPVFDQISHAIGERAGLTAARPGDDEERARLGRDRLVLFVIELRPVIDLLRRMRRGRFFQDVLERHPMSFAQAGRGAMRNSNDFSRRCDTAEEPAWGI